MSGVQARLAGLFVAPAAEEPGETWALPPAVRAVVVGAQADAAPVAAALALSLRAADRAPAAVVASWRSKTFTANSLALLAFVSKLKTTRTRPLTASTKSAPAVAAEIFFTA